MSYLVNSPITDSYQDEPEVWKEFSDAQLMEAWYEINLDEPSDALTGALSLESLDKSANKGNTKAQYTLGKMFLNGVGVNSNLLRAALWFSKASAAGNPFAQYELAKMCLSGIGVEKDSRQAADLFEKAYDKFLSIEDQHPNCAIEAKLATICENRLVHLTDSDMIVNWRRKVNGISEVVQRTAKISNEFFNPSAEKAEPDQYIEARKLLDYALTLKPDDKQKTEIDENSQVIPESAAPTVNEPATIQSTGGIVETDHSDDPVGGTEPTAQAQPTGEDEHETLDEPSEPVLQPEDDIILPQPVNQIEETYCDSKTEENENIHEPEPTRMPNSELPEQASLTPEANEKDGDEDSGKLDSGSLSDDEPAMQPQPIVSASTAPSQQLEQTSDLHEAISILEDLHVSAGDSCATLDGDQVVTGIIDRIEIYSNTVLISVEVDGLRRPYPLSEIGESLFVGEDYMNQAKMAANYI